LNYSTSPRYNPSAFSQCNPAGNQRLSTWLQLEDKMGKKKLPKVSLPEMDSLFEGMESLLVDEYGNPLPSDHPQVQRVATFMNQIATSMDNENPSNLPEHPHGHA